MTTSIITAPPPGPLVPLCDNKTISSRKIAPTSAAQPHFLNKNRTGSKTPHCQCECKIL
jgi:hypothetical protein